MIFFLKKKLCTDDQEFVTNLDYVLLCFLLQRLQSELFLCRFIILLHLISYFSLTRSYLVPYAYVSIKSTDCIVLSSFELKAIFLNLCCIFNINLLFFMSFCELF